MNRTISIFAAAMLGSLLLSPACPGQDDSNGGAPEVQLKLKNGSIFKGSLRRAEPFRLETRYGKLDVPCRDVRSITWGKVEKEERDTIRTATGTFTGWIDNETSFEVDTGFGVLRIPSDAVRQLRFLHGALAEEFGGGLDRWEIQGGSWRVEGGTLKATGTGNYMGQIHFDEELEGDYVLEASIKGNNNVGVVWHAESATDLYAVWIQQGTVYVYGGNPWWNANVMNVSWPFQPPANVFYKVRLEVEGTRATVHVNGTKVGTVTTPRDKGRVGFWILNGSAEFDDFKIEQ